MKTLFLPSLIAAFTLAATPALAQNKPDDVAKSAINAYVLFQELPGAFPGSPEPRPAPSPKVVCALTGAAVVGLLLLDGRSDAEIAQLLEVAQEKDIATLRTRIYDDLKKCVQQ